MIRAIAFDLDDTLIDTSGILAPKATLDAFKILIESGLSLTLEDCERIRLEMIKSVSHKDVFEHLAKHHGTEQTSDALAQAVDAFYSPVLPKTLPLLPGALDNLNYLKPKYSLYVVTAGFEIAQNEKIKTLGIKNFFKHIFVINSLAQQKKKDSFKKILDMENIKPNELLCIGNSLTSEITDAISLGAQSCYFQFGEDRGEADQEFYKKITYHVTNHFELIETCNL
jgi:putative hydrolase of the HAD superfamily